MWVGSDVILLINIFNFIDLFIMHNDTIIIMEENKE
jgi:hypothetical protein